MAHCALLLRCIDVLYLMNLPDPVLRVLAGMVDLAIRTIIALFEVYDVIWAVADFMWAPYQFLVNNAEAAPWPAGPDAVYVAEIFPMPCPLIVQFMIICDVVTVELTCIITHAAGLALILCLMSLIVC